VAVYTEDVEHDVVGSPGGPSEGKAAAQGFYEYLTSNVKIEDVQAAHAYHGDDFCVTEHMVKGAVPGEFIGIPGHGREVAFRLLHVFEFRDGLISRENVWLDGGAVAAQLTA
jgi:predicted ester cyclase